MKRLYKNGLPFTSPLDETLQRQLERIENNKASMIIIDGGVGEGKTTLAIHCAEFIQKSSIVFKEQLGMGGIDFQEKFTICHDKGYKVAIYDEAGDFNTRGALTNFNKRLNRLFEIYRGFRIIVVLVLPSIGVLDNSLFDKRIPRMLIHCNKRTSTAGKYSVYSLYRMYYIKHKLKKFISPPFAYSETMPNFRGWFKDLEEKRSEELNKFSTSGKELIVNQNILQSKGLLSYEDIAKKFGKSKQWVKLLFSQKKIKETTIFKKKKYFSADVLYKCERDFK